MDTKYIGNKKFYANVSRLAIPSMLQQLLSSAIGMVDTMMVSAAIGMCRFTSNHWAVNLTTELSN